MSCTFVMVPCALKNAASDTGVLLNQEATHKDNLELELCSLLLQYSCCFHHGKLVWSVVLTLFLGDLQFGWTQGHVSWVVLCQHHAH